MRHTQMAETVPTALLLGHPGHELRVFGWVQMVRPTVHVLTDGSGSTGQSRVERTTELLARMGANVGQCREKFTDAEIYQAILRRDASCFISLASEIADLWIRDDIRVVASDANEGYNPTHDLCCEIAQAAVQLVWQRTGRQIRRYTFYLTEWEGSSFVQPKDEALCISLSDEVLEQKIAAARGYSELRDEVARAIALKGANYFREEYLRPAAGWTVHEPGYEPFYEEYGEKRVATGIYQQAVRYREHMEPLVRALRSQVEHGNWVAAGAGGG